MDIDTSYVPMSDLFGNDRFLKPQGKQLDERATLIQFFADNLQKAARPIAVRLSHFSIDDLYTLKSQFKDRERRPCHLCLKAGMTGSCAHSHATASKFFWWATKTQTSEA